MTRRSGSRPSRWEPLCRRLRQSTVTTNHVSDLRGDGYGAHHDPIDRREVTRLFATALDGDQRAEAALHLLGGFDETAHHASVALATSGHNLASAIPPDVLARIDRTLAALRDYERSS